MLKGYQADIDFDNNYTGMLYEERGRTFLAPSGTFGFLGAAAEGGDAAARQSRRHRSNRDALKALVKVNDWNQFHVIARQRVIHVLNGHVTALFVDDDAANRAMKGLIGFQIHVGPPMKSSSRTSGCEAELRPHDASGASGEHRGIRQVRHVPDLSDTGLPIWLPEACHAEATPVLVGTIGICALGCRSSHRRPSRERRLQARRRRLKRPRRQRPRHKRPRPVRRGARTIRSSTPISRRSRRSPRQPAEELKTFLLPPGYHLEPVLTEPDVQEPMQIAFDGNGRMFVLENRGYMQDADATGELEPVGRISVHEDLEQRRRLRKARRLPRPPRLPALRAAVRTEQHPRDGVEYRRRVPVHGHERRRRRGQEGAVHDRTSAGSGNVEHQQSSLFLSMDNWMYTTYNTFRVRWTPKGVLREPTGTNNGQWGITQDSDGKVYFQTGEGGVPTYFQFPIHYGTFNMPGQLEPGLTTAWGVAGLGDFQPGTSAIRPGELTLNRVTGGAGNDVYRGDRLPPRSGRRLPLRRAGRANRPTTDAGRDRGITQLRQVYQWQHAEFIRSSDHLFRPVDLSTAPTARSTSSTRTAGSSRKATGRGQAATCARRSIGTSWTRSCGTAGSGGSRTTDGARPDAAADERARRRRSSSPASRTRTAGGATLPSSCWC